MNQGKGLKEKPYFNIWMNLGPAKRLKDYFELF